MEKKEEAIKKVWARRIATLGRVDEKEAKAKADKIFKLLRYMKHEEALMAYRKKNGDFRLVKATLQNYESFFGHKLDMERLPNVVAFWNIDLQEWNTFRMESFVEWRPVF